MLSSIPDSNYTTIASTTIKPNKTISSNKSFMPSTSTSKYDTNVPMTPYSYMDSISVNNNISTIKKMTRSNNNTTTNTNTYSKSSYNPNILDVLAIKQRLEDNYDYDKQQQVSSSLSPLK